MQTQDKNSIDSRENRPFGELRKPRAWMAGLSAFIVVLLVVGVSIFVFTAAGQRQAVQHPPAGQWKQVQSGELFFSIQAAPSNPAVLYACATTSVVVSNVGSAGQTSILRSADAGDHWQNIGAHVLQGDSCELAVSPTNSNEIYVVTTNNTSQSPAVLKHTTDGGQTWTSIIPAFAPPLRAPGTKTALPWFVQQLRYDGHSLYGVQWIVGRLAVIQGPTLFPNRLPRLVTSADGGHTWNIIDGQFTARGLGAQAYTLDPAHPGTIYEIAGRPWFPVETAQPNDVVPIFGIDEQLFKSVDNGASWQSLLTGLPFGSHVQLASDNSQIVYAGGIRGPLPLAAQSGKTPQGPTIPSPIGVFHLQVSTNGGASWQEVATPLNEGAIQGWFVSADGHVYTSPTVSSSTPGVGATAISGTAIVGTAVPVMPSTPVFGTPLPLRTATGGMPEIQAPPNAKPYIQRYDPASHAWSQVTTPPASGNLLQVTSADAHGGAILWYIGIADSHYALYRYIV